MTNLNSLIISILLCLTITGCKSASSDIIAVCPEESQSPSAIIPKAVIYRTVKDYSLNVPITLNNEKTKVVSFPAPSDISQSSTPLRLTDGWLLDRRGITKNSVFTSFSYDEYSRLYAPPSIGELTERIIDYNPFAEIRQLPISFAEAVSDTAKCNSIIRQSLDTCPQLFPTK